MKFVQFVFKRISAISALSAVKSKKKYVPLQKYFIRITYSIKYLKC